MLDRYTAAYQRCPDRTTALGQLTLETWLLLRQRQLHAAYRGTPDLPHLREWAALTEAVFLAYRRVERGRAEPPGLTARLRDLLERDRTAFTDPVRPVVTRIVSDVLGVPASRLPEDLTTTPTFTSFSVVEIVERIERELNAEFAAEDIVPEHLNSISELTAAADRAVADHAGRTR